MPEVCEPLSQILVSNFDPSQVIDVICTSTQSFLVYYCSTNFGAEGGCMVSVKSALGGGTGCNLPVFIVGGVPDDVITFRLWPRATTVFITLQTTCSAKASIYSPDYPCTLHPSPLVQPGPPHPHHPTRRATKRARRRGHVSRTK